MDTLKANLLLILVYTQLNISTCFPLPSLPCQYAARTENIIKCLSRNEHFQETLNGGDICHQAQLVYSCYNKTCCYENKEYDLARDPSLANCQIDCLRIPTTTTTPSTTAAMDTTTTPIPIPNQFDADTNDLGNHIHAILIFSIFPVSFMILFPLTQTFFRTDAPIHLMDRRIYGPPLSAHRKKFSVI
jgi:hypothetical protein